MIGRNGVNATGFPYNAVAAGAVRPTSEQNPIEDWQTVGNCIPSIVWRLDFGLQQSDGGYRHQCRVGDRDHRYFP